MGGTAVALLILVVAKNPSVRTPPSEDDEGRVPGIT